MQRFSTRRILVGIVALAAAFASGSEAHGFVTPMPGMRRVAPPPHPEPIDPSVARPPPPDWRVVHNPAFAWRRFLSAQRATNVARLRAYAQAGVFPENRVRPGALNVWIDPNGRLCAVANLVAQSGHRALVDHVARSNNFIRFADTAAGPLVDWSLSSGLTREEIVRIQEPYDFIPQGLPAQVEWQAQLRERARLQSHFAQVLRELEANESASVELAVSRLGVHLGEAPHDLGWDPQPAVIPQPYVQPVVVPQPFVQPVVFPQPYVQPVMVYPEPVRRPVRVDPYASPVVYPAPQPVQVYPAPQPLQVHVQVHVQANVPTPVQVPEIDY